jgi:hypothetical protein
MLYPYLGVKEMSDGGNVIVFFTEQNKGVVVMNESKVENNFIFGKYDSYNEDEFGFLKEGICVRLNN